MSLTAFSVRTTAIILLSLGAWAAWCAPRTFVASFGDDINPCSLQAPCRSFNAAQAQTDINGEVIALDTAGFGVITITKGLTIAAAPGAYVIVPALFGQHAVTIDAPTNARVILRGINVNGLGGNRGINIINALRVDIENCSIGNLTGAGVHWTKAATDTTIGYLYIKDSTLRANTGTGVVLQGGNQGRIFATLETVRIERHGGNGISALANTTVTVRNSVVADNIDAGILATSALTGLGNNGNTIVSVTNSSITGNAADGILASTITGSNRVAVHAMQNTIAGNNRGIHAFSDGGVVIINASDNIVGSNTTFGMLAYGSTSTIIASGNTVVANGTGFSQVAGAAFKSRMNNTVQNNNAQTTGTITAIEGN